MRREYRRAIREILSDRLRAMAPGFERVKIDSPLLFGGETVFRWSPGGGFLGWVLLVPDSKRQAFTLEVGWSRSNRFPELGMRPSVMLGADDPLPLDIPEGFVRLGGLSSRSDEWWDLPDAALERPGDLSALQASLEPIEAARAARDAEAPVQAAVEVLRSHGMIFLEEVARKAGVAASPRQVAPKPPDA